MKNYEKYKDLIIDSIRRDSICELAKQVYGDDCDFHKSCSECRKFVSQWLDKEYTPKIDWSKVPVDTPVICTDHRGKKFNRHFSGYENGSIAVFSYGATSWSSDGFDSVWKIDEVELAREEDVEKYSI